MSPTSLSPFCYIDSSLRVGVSTKSDWTKNVKKECFGMDKACETVERRYNKKVYYVKMGCKQQTACVEHIP